MQRREGGGRRRGEMGEGGRRGKGRGEARMWVITFESKKNGEEVSGNEIFKLLFLKVIIDTQMRRL